MKATTPREQPWRDGGTGHGRVIVLTRNPIAEAIETIACAAGREVILVEDDEDGLGLEAIRQAGPGPDDAVVLCDHDAPDAPHALRAALEGPTGYVAMMASRSRSARLLDELRAEGYGAQLGRLHVPAGLDTGGKGPGEIALSVVAEIVAVGYGRSGGPMRDA